MATATKTRTLRLTAAAFLAWPAFVVGCWALGRKHHG